MDSIGVTSRREKAEQMVRFSLAKGVFIDQVTFTIFGCVSLYEYKDYFNKFKEKYPRNKEMRLEERLGIRL